MRRSIPRGIFIAFLAASLVAVLGLLGSVARIAYAQVRPGRGGGGAGVLLQSTTPGVPQTGNVNLQGTIVLTTAGTAQSRISGSAGGGVQFLAPSGTQSSGNPVGLFQLGLTTQQIKLLAYQDIALGISGADGLQTTIGTVNAFTSVHLAGQPGVSGTVPDVVVDTPFGLSQTGGKLLSVRNNGAEKASVSFDGTPAFAVPVPQTSGGTGGGALTCAGGSFLTSNGTTYSCGAPAAAFIVAAYISSVPTVISQTGSVTLGALSHGTAGHYQIVIPGLTASAIVIGSTDVTASPGAMFTSSSAAGTLTVHMVNGANQDADLNFSFIVVKL